MSLGTSRFGKHLAGAVLALALVSLVAHPAFAQTFSCASDAQGVNDEPGQKDLTRVCVAAGSGDFELYSKWNQSKLSMNDLNQYAREAGVDMARFEKDLIDLKKKKRVVDDLAEAKTLGITARLGSSSMAISSTARSPSRSSQRSSMPS
jgi:hypothetical protein